MPESLAEVFVVEVRVLVLSYQVLQGSVNLLLILTWPTSASRKPHSAFDGGAGGPA